MTVLRIDRFTVDPTNTEEMLTRRNALVTAIREAVPGLLEARLARADDQTWIDIWRWDTLANAQAAAQHARSGGIPEAGAAFALAHILTTEFTELVDER
ncbi:MAG TPA: antibiotic biosynthesis monooxygenase [Jiangellaceae bacterium]|nr:antibiotic biosynthesis monooxygenase [Jiangellaceae bacterium]